MSTAPLELLYRDQYLLAINKPPGLASTKLNSEDTQTDHVVRRVLNQFGDYAKRVSTEPPPESGLLHRLDNQTSGVLLFCSEPILYAQIKKYWKTELVKKKYLARVSSPVPDAAPNLETIDITYPISHHKKNRRKMTCQSPRQKFFTQNSRGTPQEAITQILQVKPLGRQNLLELELEIKTGVRHQIRCHLSELGWPIVGDILYGGEPLEEGNRFFLHHLELRLSCEVLDYLGEDLVIRAPKPSFWSD